MNDEPRQKLCEIVARRKTLEARAGRDILSDPRLCKAYLMDLCGEHKREVNVLTVALEERVAVDLLASRDGVPLEILLGRLTRRLLDHRALTERAARWAVESWALALGLIEQPDTSPAPRLPQPPKPEISRSGDVGGDSPAPFTGGRIELNVQLPSPPPPPPKLPPARPGQPVTLVLAPGVELELLPVSAGPFLMGSDPDRDEDTREEELPQHVVHLDAYVIGRYPVTNAQYAVFVQAAGHSAPGDWRLGRLPSGKENHPVVKVSWDDAAAFCAWLTELLRAAWRGSGESLVARLPTEAEWEKAARGTDGRIYPWGDEKPTSRLCNFGNNVKATTAVGRYSPAGDSPYGCADMAGNVWEWCADWYADDYYAAAPDRNPTGPRDGRYWVLRGGSFDSTDYLVRCAYRCYGGPPLHVSPGFRLVASPFTSGL